MRDLLPLSAGCFPTVPDASRWWQQEVGIVRHRSADGVDLLVNDDLIFRLMQFHHLAKLVGLAGFAPPTRVSPRHRIAEDR
jgi:hypothetical protein